MNRRNNRRLELGEVVITDSFNLKPIKKIIHAPEPRWDVHNLMPKKRAPGLEAYVNKFFPS